LNLDEQIKQAIWSAIDEVNHLLPVEEQIKKSLETVLVGESAHLDSLGLVNLIVAIEQKVEERFQVSISLLMGEAMFQEQNPFSTLGTLADHTSQQIRQNSSGG